MKIQNYLLRIFKTSLLRHLKQTSWQSMHKWRSFSTSNSLLCYQDWIFFSPQTHQDPISVIKYNLKVRRTLPVRWSLTDDCSPSSRVFGGYLRCMCPRSGGSQSSEKTEDRSISINNLCSKFRECMDFRDTETCSANMQLEPSYGRSKWNYALKKQSNQQALKPYGKGV